MRPSQAAGRRTACLWPHTPEVVQQRDRPSPQVQSGAKPRDRGHRANARTSDGHPDLPIRDTTPAAESGARSTPDSSDPEPVGGSSMPTDADAEHCGRQLTGVGNRRPVGGLRTGYVSVRTEAKWPPPGPPCLVVAAGRLQECHSP
jgi:hypothetical protein